MTNMRIKNITVGSAAEGNIATGCNDQDKNKLSRTVTIRLSEKEYCMAGLLASSCGINKSALFRSLLYSVQLKARLSDEEKALLRNLGDSRRDMVNFANALSGLRIPVDTRSPIPVISVQSVGDLQYRWQS